MAPEHRAVGSRGWGSPTIVGDLLYAAFDGTDAPTMVADDLRALEPAWETSIGGGDRWMNGQPSAGGGVVVGAFGEGLDAFDAGTGAVQWSRPNVGYVNNMVVSGDRVFSVMDAEHGQVLESRVLTTGALDWHVTFAAEGSDYVSAMEPAVAGGEVVVARTAYGGTPESHFLTAYDAATGARLWERAIAPTPPRRSRTGWCSCPGRTAGCTWWGCPTASSSPP